MGFEFSELIERSIYSRICSSGVISEKLGVRDIDVSLDAKEAKVSYSSGDITADQIATYIEEMGFDAFVKEVNGQLKKPQSDTTTNNNLKNGDVIVQMNGGGDITESERYSKCFLHIKVR